MKIASQLFDRSALGTSKKDGKISVDKQGAAAASMNIPKKVFDFIFVRMIKLFEKCFITNVIDKNRLETNDVFSKSRQRNDFFVERKNRLLLAVLSLLFEHWNFHFLFCSNDVLENGRRRRISVNNDWSSTVRRSEFLHYDRHCFRSADHRETKTQRTSTKVKTNRFVFLDRLTLVRTEFRK